MKDDPGPKICVTLAFPTVRRFREGAAMAISQKADLLEFRLDYLLEALEANEFRWCHELQVPTIATLRMAADGGKYIGPEEERFARLKALSGHFQYVDLEFRSAGQERAEALREIGAQLIVSYHNFRSTPTKDELLSIAFRSKARGADICKIATRANSQDDVFTLLSLPHSVSPMVVIPMGEKGRIGRLLAPLLGAEFGYACLDGLPPVAPGMLSIGVMRQLYDGIQRVAG